MLRVGIFKGTGPGKEFLKTSVQWSTSDINGIAWSSGINGKHKLVFPLGAFMYHKIFIYFWKAGCSHYSIFIGFNCFRLKKGEQAICKSLFFFL